jgi:hypothetical protein
MEIVLVFRLSPLSMLRRNLDPLFNTFHYKYDRRHDTNSDPDTNGNGFNSKKEGLFFVKTEMLNSLSGFFSGLLCPNSSFIPINSPE